MRGVLDAINAMQAVPFAINVPLLEFMLRTGPKVPGYAWEIDMITAEAMACRDRFWIPLNIDFRGRIYGIPHFNFQREDHVRALFLFADGEPIGEDGLLWLKAHVAARADGVSWGHVKKPSELGFEERIAWTEKNLGTLCDIGNDPVKMNWAIPWDGEPYQFVAACMKLVKADGKPGFITRLPLTFDASCSGLQHLCAMTRALEGCYVNLVPADEADDFYRRVAYKTYQAVPENIRALMEGPFDRKIVKQPAMSYFYGSRPGGFAKNKKRDWRPYGMTRQVIDVLKERSKPTTGAKELAHAIYTVIEDMVPKAKAVRDFLEQLTELCTDNDKPLRWTTPLGLPVFNVYHKPKKERLAISFNGRRRRVNIITGDKAAISRVDAKNAVTANFVHSVDAVHLQLVALAAAKDGTEMASVHDCYVSIAPRARRLNENIRDQFRRLHKRHNLLNDVRQSARRDLPKNAQTPPPPQIGDLDLDEILGSFHAFK
jgi:DNA-directed RNA polymerase